MDGIHDMGGMHGFGPVEPETDEPVLHEWWEAQAIALSLVTAVAPWESRAFGLAAAHVEASGGGWDRFRSHLVAAIARLPDGTPYYAAWVAAIEDLLSEGGVATAAGGHR